MDGIGDVLGPAISGLGVLLLVFGIYKLMKDKNTRKRNMKRIAEARGDRD